MYGRLIESFSRHSDLHSLLLLCSYFFEKLRLLVQTVVAHALLNLWITLSFMNTQKSDGRFAYSEIQFSFDSFRFIYENVCDSIVYGACVFSSVRIFAVNAFISFSRMFLRLLFACCLLAFRSGRRLN